jgi:hypothetical protein
MHYLYASRAGESLKLVSTFDSEQQLRAYVGWATLIVHDDGRRKFEQGSTLAGFDRFEEGEKPRTANDEAAVPHNPSPNML